MMHLCATGLPAAWVVLPAVAADRMQQVTIKRSSTTDRTSGLVVQGNSVVPVPGAPGMGAANQAVRFTPDGNRLRVLYDTVGGRGVNTAGLQPIRMMSGAGSMWPICRMASGAN